jgi:hypothetical protein
MQGVTYDENRSRIRTRHQTASHGSPAQRHPRRAPHRRVTDIAAADRHHARNTIRPLALPGTI